MKKIVLLALVFSLFATIFVSAQKQQTQKEIFETTYHNSKALVESQQFQFFGETFFNGKKRERLNSESNKLDISDSTITGQLSTLSTENKTYDIKGDIENYKVTYNDEKQLILMEFSVNKVNYNIEVKPNGKAHLTTLDSAKNTLTWIGQLKN